MIHALTVHSDLVDAVTGALAKSGATLDVDGYRFKIDSTGTLLARNLNADRPTVYRRVVTA